MKNIWRIYISIKYGQMWQSLKERKKEKEWLYWSYYSDWDWIVQNWEEVIYDVFRKWGDIKKYSREKNIDDFKFLWWGFDWVVK